MRGSTEERNRRVVYIAIVVYILAFCVWIRRCEGFEADTNGIVVLIVRKGDDSWRSFFNSGRDSIITDTVNVIQYRDGVVWLKYQSGRYDTLEVIGSGGADTMRVFYRKIIREVPYSMSEWTIIKKDCLRD